MCIVVMQGFQVVNHGVSHQSHTRLKVQVYTKKIQVTSGIFHDIPRESVG